MASMWNRLASSPMAQVSALGVLALLLLAVLVFGVRAWITGRISPEERERRRRGELAAIGKMGDATLVEIGQDFLFYSYLVGGVAYTASQDITGLHDWLPHDFSALGTVAVKYDPRNPANSIVLAEQWSGLSVRKAG